MSWFSVPHLSAGHLRGNSPLSRVRAHYLAHYLGPGLWGGGSFTPSTPLVDFAVRLFEARHGGMGKCGSPANKIQGLVRIHVEFFRTDITLPRHLRLITSTTELKASIRRIQATVTLVIAWACACPRHTTHRIRNFGLYRRASEGFLAPNCPVSSHQVCEVARR